MEVALTFGAFGDLLALGILIKDIIACLDDCRGSSKEYQDLVRSLTILDSTLNEVDQIFRDPRRASSARRLCDTALKSIRQIQESLKAFSHKLQKYRSSLIPGGSGNRIKDVARKIQFKLDEKELAKLRGEVTGYTVALNLLMEAMTLHALEQSYEQVTRSLTDVGGEVQQTRRDVETASRTLINYVTGIGQQVVEKIAFLARETLDVKRSVSHIASTVLSLSLEFSSFRLLLMSFQRNPVDEYYFTVEDALGRVFPIHLNTITSWEAFAFVLSEKFKGATGARRVRDRRYRLTEHATRREIDQSNNWERAFRPYQKIAMSLLCKDADQTSESNGQLATCPWCKTESRSDTITQVQCRSCNMFFTRVVELDDMALPPHPSGNSRQAPEFGRPSFNVQLPPGWTENQRKKRPRDGDGTRDPNKRFKFNSHRTRKRSHDDDDDDVESDDEDVNGLVRVTVVSRRKRIKIFQASPSGQTISQSYLGGFAGLQRLSFNPPAAKDPPSDWTHQATALKGDINHQQTEPVLPFSVALAEYPYDKYKNIRRREIVKDVDDDRMGDEENVLEEASSDSESPGGDSPEYSENIHNGDCKPTIFIRRKPDYELSISYLDRGGQPLKKPSSRGATLDERYKFPEVIHSSASQYVVKAYDTREQSYVAIKIFRSRGDSRSTWYPATGHPSVIVKNNLGRKQVWPHQLSDSFILEGHQCLVADYHGQSLLKLVRSAPPLAIRQIQSIARQLFDIVALATELDFAIGPQSLNLEAVVLVDDLYDWRSIPVMEIPSVRNMPRRSTNRQVVLSNTAVQLKLNDSMQLSTPPFNLYGAPETILSDRCSTHAGDVWSIGLILLELFTHDTVSNVGSVPERLAIIERLCSDEVDSSRLRWVDEVISNGHFWWLFKDGKLNFPSPDTRPKTFEHINSIKNIEEIIQSNGDPFLDRFRDLLQRIFVLDPDKRITAKEALAHPWFEDSPQVSEQLPSSAPLNSP